MTQGSPESQSGQLSPDGRWRWDGTQWVAVQGSPQWVPPVGAQQSMQPVPARTMPAAGGVAYQFGGSALWSIVFGAASVVVPFVPFGDQRIYFPILPIFGLWRGVLAIRHRRLAGGVIGLVLNAIGCLVSLLASGLLDNAIR